MFFSRRRSLLFKVLLLVPAAWFLVALFLGTGGGGGNHAGINKEPEALRRISQVKQNDVIPESDVIKQHDVILPRIPLRDTNNNNNDAAVVETNNKVVEDSNSNNNELNNNINNRIDNNNQEVGVLQPPRDPDGPGEMGKPVHIPKNMTGSKKKLYDDGWQNNAFNQYASDMISVHRSLPDPRDDECKTKGKYLEDLPQTSVVVCFHNEAWSVLLRTVHSILDRSPKHLIKEIVLVDDFSDMEHLQEQLEDYMSQYPKVKVVRLKKREGLIRARLAGAKYVTAPVLTYLDSHCECAEGWLEPLLDRIARNRTTVVCPVIDVIDDDTLEFHYRDSTGVNVGGFDWNLQFNWHAVPDREKKRRHHSSDPVWSPTMAGGLFSIDKSFFEELGTYDNGFDIWGGENLELSFKTWMCGGVLEIIPCSHVGHIFRKRSPYKWRTGVNVLKRNSVRLAEVWLDDYKKYYYQRLGFDLGEYGDVKTRKQLRDKLQCKSFKWYLDTIYPELFIPGDAIASGEVRNLGDGANMCLDSPARRQDLHKSVTLYPCHRQGGNQFWMLSKTGEIRRDEACLDYAGQDVIIYPCHGSKGNQFWLYDDNMHTIQHGSSKKCLEMGTDKKRLTMSECDIHNPRQRWKFQNTASRPAPGGIGP